ncbi:MAG TPA: hypothetical protein VGG72_24365 [Bryobacteraceae bacterium]|jgi:hypothetical protein
MQFAVDLATPADDAAIRALLGREPMPGRVRIIYRREPEFRLGCEATADDCQVLVARQEGSTEVVGLACRSGRRVFINGQPQRIGYLGQLRVDPRFRGRWLVSQGFRQMKALHDRDPVPGYLASIVGGNSEATGVLVRNRRRIFPEFRSVADYRTLAIDLHRAKPAFHADVEISTPCAGERAEVAMFLQHNGPQRQFFPVWNEENLKRLSSFGLAMEDLRIARRGGKIVGVAGLWDQSCYKQTTVHSYTGWLKAIAPLYNLGAPRFGRAPLPRAGETLRSAYASLICIANDEITVFRALLREIYNHARERRLSHLLVGLDARDPLLRAVREYVHVVYPSRLYLAEYPDGERIYEQLDGRPAYVDIATL